MKDRQLFLSAKEEKERYLTHNNDVNDKNYQAFTSLITNEILTQFTPNHLGLDYGCGTGPVISSQLRKQDYNVNLYDPFFYPNKAYKNYTYDYIFSCEVFEHFYQPKKEISHLLSLLKPKGKLLIMTHLYHEQIDFSNWYYRNDPTHVFIYTKETMQFIAKEFQLKIEQVSERLTVFSK